MDYLLSKFLIVHSHLELVKAHCLILILIIPLEARDGILCKSITIVKVTKKSR